MTSRTLLWVGAATVIAVLGIVVLSVYLTPEGLNPAFAAATEFMNAAGQGDDEAALALLTEGLQAYAGENCPGGSVSACLQEYIPPEWGGFIAAVYRRSIPYGADWDVLLVATYEEDQGFSGVCIYHRVTEVAPGDWRVSVWSGFVSCDLPNSGLQGLRAEDAPNRVPPAP
jgi:hypothetical protein